MTPTPFIIAADKLTGGQVVNEPCVDLGKITHLILDMQKTAASPVRAYHSGLSSIAEVRGAGFLGKVCYLMLAHEVHASIH